MPSREEIEARLALAECRQAEARAEIVEAEAIAATNTATQDLWERQELLRVEVVTRRTNLAMEVLVSFYVMAVLVLGAVFHSWLIPAGLGAAGIAYLAKRWLSRDRGSADGTVET